MYLPNPVNVLDDFQLEFNGLLMGAGTPYDVPPTWQVFDMASLKTMDQARPWADGSWSGPDFSDVATISMDLDIVGEPDDGSFSAAVLALMRALAPSSDALPLWVKVPFFQPMGFWAKANKRSIPIDVSWGQLSSASVQWRCPDPAFMSEASTFSLGASGALVSGLNFPLFDPVTAAYVVPGVLDFGSTAASPSSVVVSNGGNTDAWPYVVITGPCTGFSLSVDSNLVSYSGSLNAGQQLVVDYAAGTATLDDGNDRTYLLTSRDFSAVPADGSSTVGFIASSGSATVTIADVWR